MSSESDLYEQAELHHDAQCWRDVVKNGLPVYDEYHGVERKAYYVEDRGDDSVGISPSAYFSLPIPDDNDPLNMEIEEGVDLPLPPCEGPDDELKLALKWMIANRYWVDVSRGEFRVMRGNWSHVIACGTDDEIAILAAYRARNSK